MGVIANLLQLIRELMYQMLSQKKIDWMMEKEDGTYRKNYAKQSKQRERKH